MTKSESIQQNESVSGIDNCQFLIWIIVTAKEEGTLTTLDYVVPNPATRVRKLLYNIIISYTALLASIASVQNSTNLKNHFEQIVDTLQSAIRASKITITQKQMISALTGGRGDRGVHGGRGRGGGGNHYQNKHFYKVGRRGREAHGGRGSSDKRV